MRQLPFDIEEDREDCPAVGLVVLQTDETMEHELRHWLPANTRLFHTRIPNRIDINHDSLQAMKQALPESVALLPASTDFKVIAYGCTSAATVIGEQAVTDAVRSVFPGVAVTNPLSAIKARLVHLNAHRIALLTPYVPQVSQSMVDALESSGFNVVSVASFHEEHDDRVARIAQHSLLNAMTTLAGEGPVDAIVAACTNLRTRGLTERASEQLGIPVISSNAALSWHIQSLL
ncbi:MAG: Asp/Glu racemase [Granulosicoccus sp.]|nr:Asp/Glu racemase [Granulosicoccus sp.]